MQTLDFLNTTFFFILFKDFLFNTSFFLYPFKILLSFFIPIKYYFLFKMLLSPLAFCSIPV